ncbi:MAG: hypothetical protein D6780_02810 [Candidatus Dadabacteria bacterium]|nr:MAG: hypothetical protein D6780_02810 [Candidatus Dadabacteria bacterium]
MSLIPLRKLRKALGLPSEVFLFLIEEGSLPIKVVDGKVMVEDDSLELKQVVSSILEKKALSFKKEEELSSEEEILREKVAQEAAQFFYSCFNDAWEQAVRKLAQKQ